ncbi:MAG: hypothetical protein ACR2NU_09585, partial [Aeoliella sp.]
MNGWRESAIVILIAAAFWSVATRPCAAVGFTDVTVAAGVNYIQWQLPVTDTDAIHHMSGGAAAGDFDNDGW